MRFFTWRSFAALAYRAGWLVEERRVTGLPLEILERERTSGGAKQSLGRLAGVFDRAGRAVWPSLFAYQFVAVLSRDPARLRTDERSESTLAPGNTGLTAYSSGYDR